MKTSEQKTPEDANLDLLQSGRMTAFLNVSFYTVATMAVLGGGGYLLDQWLGIFPALFITGLVIAFPLSQFFLYKRLRKLMNQKFKDHKSK